MCKTVFLCAIFVVFVYRREGEVFVEGRECFWFFEGGECGLVGLILHARCEHSSVEGVFLFGQ